MTNDEDIVRLRVAVNHRLQIPAEAYLNALLLQFLRQGCNLRQAQERIAQQLGAPGYLHPIENAAQVVLLMYGLLVVPKEFWFPKKTKIEQITDYLKTFDQDTFKAFEVLEWPPDEVRPKEYMILYYLRNSIAHANFLIFGETFCDAIWYFWNTPPNSDKINAILRITTNKLFVFLSAVGYQLARRARKEGSEAPKEIENLIIKDLPGAP